MQQLTRFIWRAAAIKAEVVSLDERESKLRSILNFGHTIGHAVEACLTPELLHGEAVAVGMVMELEVARFVGCCSDATRARIQKLIKSYGLPTSLQEVFKNASDELSLNSIMQYMAVDKKNVNGRKKIVMIT